MKKLLQNNIIIIFLSIVFSFALSFIISLPIDSFFKAESSKIDSRVELSLYDFSPYNVNVFDNGSVKNLSDPQLHYSLEKRTYVSNILIVLKDMSGGLSIQAFYKNSNHDFSEKFSVSKRISNTDFLTNLILKDEVDVLRLDIGVKGESLRIKKIIINPNFSDYLKYYLRYPAYFDFFKIFVTVLSFVYFIFRKYLLDGVRESRILFFLKNNNAVSNFIKRTDLKNHLSKIYEYCVCIFLYAFLSVYYIEIGSMIEINWFFDVNKIPLFFSQVFCVIALLRMIFDRNYLYLVISLMMVLTISISHFIAYNDLYILVTIYVAVGCYKIRYKKILLILILSVGLLVFLEVILSLYDVIPNLQYHSNRGIRNSFGSNYPTDFAAAILYLILSLWMFVKGKDYIVLILLIIFIYVQLNFTFTRNTIICSLLLFALISFYLVKKIFHQFNVLNYFELIFVKCFSLVSFSLLALISIYISYIYNWSDDYIRHLDDIFSGRFSITHRLIQEEGFSLFGKHIRLIGFGSTTEPIIEEYNFLDISYCNILLRFGIISTIILAFSNVVLVLRSINENLIKLTYVIILISVHCFVEHHYLEGCYNVFIFLSFANFVCEKEGKCNTNLQNNE